VKKKVKYLIPIGLSFILFLLILILLPFLFQEKIKNTIIDSACNKTDAEIYFDSFDIDMVSHFPNITFSFNNLCISKTISLQKDTLIKVKSFDLVFKIKSLIAGNYDVTQIKLNKAEINMKQFADGQVNWNISKHTETKTESNIFSKFKKEDNDSELSFKLNKILLHDCSLVYENQQNNLKACLTDWNVTLSKSLSSGNTFFKIKSDVDEITLNLNGINILSKIKAAAQASIKADFDNRKFIFEDNYFQLNDLKTSLEGHIAVKDRSNIGLDLILNGNNELKVKDFLSILPFFSTKDFDKINSSGKISLNGFINGCINEKQYPGFGLNLVIDDAKIHYEDQPQPIDSINISMGILCREGKLENIKANIDKFTFRWGANNFSANFNLLKQKTHPYIQAYVKGFLDLSSLKDIYPFDKNTNIGGICTADLSITSYFSGPDKQQVEYTSTGLLQLYNAIFKFAQKPDILVDDLKLIFSKQRIDLLMKRIKLGENDISGTGHCENILPFILNNKIVTGQITLKSDYLNLDHFITKNKEIVLLKQTDSLTYRKKTVDNNFHFPRKLHLTVDSDIKHILIRNININNLTGHVTTHNGDVTIHQITAKTLGGLVSLTGSYNFLTDLQQNQAKLNLNLEKASFSETLEAIKNTRDIPYSSIEISGDYSININATACVEKDLINSLQNLKASGLFHSPGLIINNVNSLSYLPAGSKSDSINSIVVNNMTVPFDIKDRKVETKLFYIVTENDGKVSLEGSIGLDKTIDYKGTFSLTPNQKNSLIKNIPFTVDGTLTNPAISLDTKSIFNNIRM